MTIFERDERGVQIRAGLEAVASALRRLGIAVLASAAILAFAMMR